MIQVVLAYCLASSVVFNVYWMVVAYVLNKDNRHWQEQAEVLKQRAYDKYSQFKL